MDCILIRDLRVAVRIGIYEHEQHDAQTVSVDLEIGLPGDRAFRTDKIGDTIDYAQVVAAIRALGASRHFGLIEYFSECIAGLLIDEFGAPWVKLRAAKVGVVTDAQFVGVSISRRRPGTQAVKRVA